MPMKKFKEFSQSERWAMLVEACKRALLAMGYAIEREPGRGLANMHQVMHNGKKKRLAIRTTQDRFIAFPPMKGGKVFKTLDEVDLVILAAVDNKEDPRRVDVYMFDRDEMRKRFVAAYEARAKAKQVPKDGFGMWINGDPDDRGIPASVGSGLLAIRSPVAQYNFEALLKPQASDATPATTIPEPEAALHLAGVTIADVLRQARERIAAIAGVRAESVRIEVKFES
jgi:hypothetical protein